MVKKDKWSKEALKRLANRIELNGDKRQDYTKTQKARIEKMPDIGGRY